MTAYEGLLDAFLGKPRKKKRRKPLSADLVYHEIKRHKAAADVKDTSPPLPPYPTMVPTPPNRKKIVADTVYVEGSPDLPLAPAQASFDKAWATAQAYPGKAELLYAYDLAVAAATEEIPVNPNPWITHAHKKSRFPKKPEFY